MSRVWSSLTAEPLLPRLSTEPFKLSADAVPLLVSAGFVAGVVSAIGVSLTSDFTSRFRLDQAGFPSATVTAVALLPDRTTARPEATVPSSE